MTQPYSSPPPNLRSLRDRLTQAAQRQGVVFGRLQRHVAMIVVAQFAAMLTDDNGAPLLLVKGGSSLELRRGIPDSRTSKDFDTVARHDIEQVHDQLAEAGEAGWEGFTAVFTAPEEIDVPGMPVKPRRFTAKLNYRGKPFASVPIEVSTVEAGNADQFDTLTSDALGLVGALNEELSEHLGCDRHDLAGHASGNSRNGTCSKTVLTDFCSSIDIDVSRDRAGTFDPMHRQEAPAPG
jgi:hypothetical protein